MKRCNVCVQIYFVVCGYPVVTLPLLKIFFPPLYCFRSFVKYQIYPLKDYICVGLFLGSLVCFNDLFVYYFTKRVCLLILYFSKSLKGNLHLFSQKSHYFVDVGCYGQYYRKAKRLILLFKRTYHLLISFMLWALGRLYIRRNACA